MPNRNLFFALLVSSATSCSIYDAELLAQSGQQFNEEAALSTGGQATTTITVQPEPSGQLPPAAAGSPGVAHPPCDHGPMRSAFSNPAIGRTAIFDHFDNGWRNLGDGTPFSGFWTVSHDDIDGTNGSLRPSLDDWSYEVNACDELLGSALHITGEGYEVWGAGFDATLDVEQAEVDLSAYQGIAFWARSDAGNQIKFAITDGDSSSPSNAAPVFVGTAWKEYVVPFPHQANTTKAQVMHLVIVAAPRFDLWIDELSFYAAPESAGGSGNGIK